MPQMPSDLTSNQFDVTGQGTFLSVPEIKSWIEALPLADVNETGHRVLGALLKVKDGGLSGLDRFETLESFRRPTQYLSDALRHQFIGISLPLSHRTNASVSQLYALFMEMVEGYQAISDELLELNTLRQDFTTLATCLQRSLYYLGQSLLIRYQVYATCDANYWRRIHSTYETAERKGVQSSIVKDSYRRNNHGTSIEDQYKQILLLSLANPYRCSQADMARIYAQLEEWALHAKLYPADHLNEPESAGFVDLASDQAPCFISYNTVPHSTSCRFLDTSGLIDVLLSSMPQTPDSPTIRSNKKDPSRTTKRWRKFTRTLITAWCSATKRKYSRMPPKTTTVTVKLGLSGIHRLIVCVNPEPNEIGGDNQSSTSNIKTTRSNSRSTRADDNETYLCEVINESPDGACLKWSKAHEGKLRVGELVAINQAHESGETPGIAVIRWLKTSSNRSVEFGIQLLSPDAIPITIRLYNSKDGLAEHDYLKGLYIPEFKPANQPVSLILPAFLYKSNDVISLIMDQQEHCLVLQKIVETTQGFSRFRFTTLATPQA